MEKVVAFIPVRGGSKSIPKKNIRLFCGKPLIYWNCAELEKSSEVDHVVVATDSDEIQSAVESFGFKKLNVYRRRSENATDTSSTESVMLEYLEIYNSGQEAGYPVEDDIFLLVQATSPFTRAQDFDSAVMLLRDGAYDSILSCVRTKRFFWNPDGTPLNYDYRNRPRRQDFDGLLMENGAFYVNRIGNIIRDQNRLSGRIGIYEMPEFTATEIDEQHDWLIAEHLMRAKNLDKSLFNNTNNKINLFITDVDGTLTDAGMYYDQDGNELKKFNTRDGKAFELLRNAGIKTGMITSEITSIVDKRAKKLKVDFIRQGVSGSEKVKTVREICDTLGISFKNVAYIGDDLNCIELLQSVGYSACPYDAVDQVKNIPGIHVLSNKGGRGAVREWCDYLFNLIVNTGNK